MDVEDPSVLRILVATDNHLGYMEKDPIRGQDSFDAFEEILQYARDLQVDFMVLGGDLFHDNKPSRRTIHTAMELFRHYCFGDKESQLEFLSDPSVNFHSRFAGPNYLDPNLNISIPVFAIHGNHDDPAGDGNLSAMDLMSTAGLLNYFGRAKEVDDISISPIILRKGDSNLCLYGLGNIRDERLHRTFTSGRVKMLRPTALQEAQPDKWFNLMLFHQNRAAHSPKNHIPETFLDDFLDLIIWGHEHDCLIDPLYFPQRDFYVSQPGSSTITSLSEGEAGQKHVALLLVKGSQFELRPLPLRSTRPFQFADFVLGPEDEDLKLVQSKITAQVEKMILAAKQQWTSGNPDKPCPLPLIRLRVDHSSSPSFARQQGAINPQRFGQSFVDKVANPRDMIMFHRKRQSSRPANHNDHQKTAITIPQDVSNVVHVEDLVSEFLSHQRLDLLPQNEFSDIVKIFVEKDDKDAIEVFLKNSLKRTIGLLKEKHAIDSLRDEISKVRLEREAEWRTLNPDTNTAVMNHRVASAAVREKEADSVVSSADEMENENVHNSPSQTPTKPAPRPRATRTPSTRGRGAAAKRATPLQLSTPTAPTEEPSVKRSRWPTKK